ncbi:hypothetical protein [Azospirillum sp. SYSU D00513]|uniref:hypothetical protein n=1 Tax=Azospirillum sp. SYSU D00513 TaxID=2812561 RepID=UPI001A9610ED|nr:hypothetical protein [Azospirillum sp. SYSU D00513]
MRELNHLITTIRASGGELVLRDGRLVVRGELPDMLLMRAHRHRKTLERWLANQTT